MRAFSAIILLILLCPMLLRAGVPRVSMERSPMVVVDQQVHSMTIRIDSVDALFAFSVTIGYDAAALDVIAAVSLDFLSNGGNSTAKFLDYMTPGTIQSDESILGVNPQTTKAGGLFTVFFRVPSGQAGIAKKVPVIVSSCRMRDELNTVVTCATDTGWIYLYPAFVRTKVFLQGPFVTTTGAMHTQLRDADYTDQRTSPYTQDPVSYGRQLPPNVVDWVLVELRGTYNGAVLASKSCFLREDGMIVYPDSTAAQDVPFDVAAANYYIVVRHRNHLGVQSANAIALGGTGNTNLYNFTTGQGQAYGIAAMTTPATGIYTLYAGDTDFDTEVNAIDRNNTWNYRNQVALLGSDVNLDGEVNALDRNITWNNRNIVSQIP